MSPKSLRYQNLADYLAAGGYSVLESCRSGRRDFDQIVNELLKPA